MATGFALTVADGMAEWRLLGTEAGRRLVATAATGGVRLVLYGRLTYREDLRAALGADALPADQTPQYTSTPDNGGDAALALAAYLRWDVDGLTRLEGDFALAVVDQDRGRVLATRDPMGGYPLYWTWRGDTFALATALRPLDDLLGAAAPDIGFLGEIQMMPFFEIDHLEETALTGINRLLPGTHLEAEIVRPEPRITRFWSWPDRMDDGATGTLDIAAERYGELLDAAVAQRLRGTVGAHLSGGMDSTSVALLAQRHLSAENRPLHALTMVYERLFGLASEAPYVLAVQGRTGLVSHHVAGDDVLDFDHFAGDLDHDEPYPGFFRVPSAKCMADAALNVGADTVMTGLGADELAADMPHYLADELARGRLATAWLEAARWAKASSRSPWNTFRPFALDPLMPVWLRPGLRALFTAGYAPLNRRNGWTIPPWVQRDFARQGALRDRVLGSWRRATRSADTVVLSYALEALATTAGDWVRATLAAPRGLHITHPFRDPRLIAHALASRVRLRPVPGEQKAILGRAMRDVLPEAIVRRRDKGNFNAVYYKGLTRNRPTLNRLVDRAEDLGEWLFDRALLKDCILQASLGTDSVQRTHGINNSLAILYWLDRLPRWRATPLTASSLGATSPADRVQA